MTNSRFSPVRQPAPRLQQHCGASRLQDVLEAQAKLHIFPLHGMPLTTRTMTPSTHLNRCVPCVRPSR